MGGRGRGRGRGGSSMSLNLEALGIGRGEAMPTASVQPPPLFPVLEHHPLPLDQNEKFNYLIDLKRYFQTSMEDSPYYVKRVDDKKDIARYSDKYKMSNSASAEPSVILYSRVPEELWPQKKKKKTVKKSKSNAQTVQNAIQQLEQKEGEGSKVESGDEAAAGSDAEKSGDEDEKEVADENLELDEEDMEEDNDYIQEYFDNGEDFGDVDDGDDDGPVY